jgi:hypothetical protein
MSASQNEQLFYGILEEDDFEVDYHCFVEERVGDDGPVSLRQLKQELENEKRYDNSTEPEDVSIKDFFSIAG